MDEVVVDFEGGKSTPRFDVGRSNENGGHDREALMRSRAHGSLLIVSTGQKSMDSGYWPVLAVFLNVF